jgi:hypothetical protein
MVARFTALLVMAWAAWAAFVPAAQAQSELDNKTFVVMQTDPSGAASGGNVDVLIFNAGMFESVACRMWGYTPASHTAEAVTSAEGGTAFTSTTTSPSEGSISWSGTVYADRVVGTATWHKEGQDDVTWTFEGGLASTALDGRNFALVGTDPAGTSSPDTLSFAAGMATSSQCTQYGFAPSPYATQTDESGATQVMFAAFSPTEGLMMWTGEITGDAIAGQFTWTKVGQDNITYTFTGTAATP